MNEATQRLPGVCANASERLTDLRRKSQAMAQLSWDRTRNTARAADDYVHDSPWRLIGAAALVAAEVGYVLGRR